jgi:hypothetical protein
MFRSSPLQCLLLVVVLHNSTPSLISHPQMGLPFQGWSFDVARWIANCSTARLTGRLQFMRIGYLFAYALASEFADD